MIVILIILNQELRVAMKIFSIFRLSITTFIHKFIRINKKLKNFIYILTIILFLPQISCIKTPPEAPGPPESRAGDLIAYNWGLISATSINSLSSGAMRNYKGNPSDSLHFVWTLNGSLTLNAICSFIQGNGDSAITNIISYAAESGVNHADTGTIAYDTIITSTPWRPSYSDTLLISKTSSTMLVFQIGYSDSTGTGVEIDSFRNVGLYRPF
jgi:hypothetical protein